MELKTQSKLQWFKSNCILIACFCVYIFVVFVSVFHHEPYRDEAQAWLIVRDLGFTDMLKQLSYEGHFVLWYLVLYPFVKLGFPFFTLNIISAVFAIIAVGFILFKSPINKYLRCVIIFISPLVYFYPVISRCYSMLPLALVLVALTHEKRHENPVRYLMALLFLANVHIFLWGLLFALALEFFIEYLILIRKNGVINREFYAMIIALVFLFVSAIPLFIAINQNKETSNAVWSWDESYQLMFVKTMESDIAIIAGLVFIFMAIAAFFIAWRETIFLLSFVLVHLFISSHYFFSNDTRSSTWIFILIFVFWIYHENSRKKNLLKFTSNKIIHTIVSIFVFSCLCFFIIMNLFTSYIRTRNDYYFKISNAKSAAEFVNQNLEEDAVLIVTNNPELATPITAYFDPNSNVRLINYGSGKYYTFQVWDEYTYVSLDGNLTDFINDNLSDCEHIYILMTSNYNKENVTEEGEKNDYQYILSYVDQGLLTRVYSDESDALYYGENYAIFRVNN